MTRRVLRENESLRAVREAHVQFHDGRDRVMASLSSLFVIHQLQSKVTEVIRLCETCCMTNATTTKLPMHPILSQNPGERLVADMKMMPNVDEATQARYLLVVVDHFSKFCWVFCLPTKDSQPIADRIHAVIQEVQSHHKVVFVHTDNGREFVNEALSAITESSGATRITGRPYHPQSQGVVERKNRTLYSKLVKLAKTRPADWAKEVQPVVVNENNQVARTTGVRPHLLLWGHDHASCPGGQHAQLSLEEWDKLKHEVRERMYEKGEKAKKAVEQRRPSTKLKVGDHVLVKTVNRSERRSAKVLEPTFSVRAVVSEVLVGCKFRLNWSEDWARGEIGEESKQIWYLKDLKKIQTKPVFDWDAAAEIDPLKSGEVDEQLGNASPSTTVPPRIGSQKNKSARKRSAGTTSGVRPEKEKHGDGANHSLVDESMVDAMNASVAPASQKRHMDVPSGDRRPKKKKKKTSKPVVAIVFGQELWDNGVNGCFFYTVLAMLLAVKAWVPDIEQLAAGCSPMVKEMLACVPAWDPLQIRRGKPTERVGVHQILTERAQKLRDDCCVWFNLSFGANGDFGGPNSIWASIFLKRFCLGADSQLVVEDAPIQFASADELVETTAWFGCTASRHFTCEQCNHCKTSRIKDLGMNHNIRISSSPKAARRRLGETIQNLFTAIEKQSRCFQMIPVQSSSQPNAVNNLEQCNYLRLSTYSDVTPGRFFVMWFNVLDARKVTNKQMPIWEPEFQLTSSKGTKNYRVVAILSNTSSSRDHFNTRMLDPDGTWWAYDGLANMHCSIQIPAVDHLSPLDNGLMIMEIRDE